MNYLIESKDDENLLKFLASDSSGEDKFTRSKCFLKLKNMQFSSITQTSLFEHYSKVCILDTTRKEEGKDELANKFFLVLFSLLEEITEVNDINNDVLIINFIKFVINLNKDNVGKEEYEYHEKLLWLVVAYFKASDEHYETYKKKVIGINPSFEMIFHVIEGNDKAFIENFLDIVDSIELMHRESDCSSTRISFALLVCAINNERTLIIDYILKYENFEKEEIRFPYNMRFKQTCHYVACKMLKRGSKIWNREIPQSWLSADDFLDLLNSRINYEGENLIELDMSFLQCDGIKSQVNQTELIANNEWILSEDTTPLDYLVNNESLECTLNHPIMSIFIDLKTLKFQKVYFILFIFAFLFIVIIPVFSSTLFVHDSKADGLNIPIIVILGIIAILALLIILPLITMSLQVEVLNRTAQALIKYFMYFVPFYFFMKVIFMTYLQFKKKFIEDTLEAELSKKITLNNLNSDDDVDREARTEDMYLELTEDFKENVFLQLESLVLTLISFIFIFSTCFKDIQEILGKPKELSKLSWKAKRLISTCHKFTKLR